LPVKVWQVFTPRTPRVCLGIEENGEMFGSASISIPGCGCRTRCPEHQVRIYDL
jgi:hypothetical protein